MNIEKEIYQWITEDLSKRSEAFLGLPPCPYAAEALLKGRVQITECDPKKAYIQLEQALEKFESSKLEILVLVSRDWHFYPVEDLQVFIKEMREKYYSRDLWPLYDHPSCRESVGEKNLNHGNLLLFMVQSLSSLVIKSRDLQKQGYYNNWSSDYFEEVVELREKYYNKLVNPHERMI